jgi:hypothetical protein
MAEEVVRCVAVVAEDPRCYCCRQHSIQDKKVLLGGALLFYFRGEKGCFMAMIFPSRRLH